MTRSFGDALEETLGFVQRGLDRIQAGESAEVELHNVRAYLLEIWSAPLQPDRPTAND